MLICLVVFSAHRIARNVAVGGVKQRWMGSLPFASLGFMSRTNTITPLVCLYLKLQAIAIYCTSFVENRVVLWINDKCEQICVPFGAYKV